MNQSSTYESSPERYIVAVDRALAGLEVRERDELLEAVRERLGEFSAGVDIESELGTPETYAAELALAAGHIGISGVETLTRPVEARSQSRFRRRSAELKARYSKLADAVRRVDESHPALRHTWWGIRGWFLVQVLASIAGVRVLFPVPRVGNDLEPGIVAVLVGIGLSVAASTRFPPPYHRNTNRLMAIGAVLLLVNMYNEAEDARFITDRPNYVSNLDSSSSRSSTCLTDGGGADIQNIFVFDAEGHPLQNVFLTNEKGQPIDNLCPLTVHSNGRKLQTDYARDALGNQVYGVFPRHQSVAASFEPNAVMTKLPTPAVVLPKLAAEPFAPVSTTGPYAPSSTSTSLTLGSEQGGG